MNQIIEGVLWYAAFLFSTTLHEASHAFAALKLGDRTAYEGGQVSLSPTPHMKREPVGMIIVPVISYLVGGWMIGWASIPYNREWALNHPKSLAKMSIAGPAANLFLALFAALIIRMGMMLNIFVPPETIDFTRVIIAKNEGAFSLIAQFINIIFSLNLLLFLFNILPIPPLDGSAVVPLFLHEELARKYLGFIQNPSFSFIGLICAWKFFAFVYGPFHLVCINILFYSEAYYK